MLACQAINQRLPANAKQCDQAKELIDAKSLIIMDALRRDTNNHSRLSLNQMSWLMGGAPASWMRG